MNPGPAERVLGAFCGLADGWFNGEVRPEPRKVDCAPHGGRFDREELDTVPVRAPAVRTTGLGVVSAHDDGDGAAVLELRLAAAVICKDAPGEGRDDMARRLATRIAFELAGAQPWAKRVFSADELDPARADGPRGYGIGEPSEIRAANLYSAALNKRQIAIWVVTWRQGFRALPEDFDLPFPAGGEPADTVKTGFVPKIGKGHEDDYGTVVPQEAG